MLILNNNLLKNNAHDRDKNIIFTETGHKYNILNDSSSQYTSVTTLIHAQFEKFDADNVITKMMKGKNWNSNNKYWGLTPDEIKQQWSDLASSASSAGSIMHYNIECFMNNPDLSNNYTHSDLYDYYINNNKKNIYDISDDIEWTYVIKFIQEYPSLKPYRTEWIIYDEKLKLAGSIDMVYENTDGTISIYDWKRSKKIDIIHGWNKVSKTDCLSHLPDTNFWHYSLQLNIYKAIIQTNYNKIVTDLYLVRIHPNNLNDTFELIKVPDLQKEVKLLFDTIK